MNNIHKSLGTYKQITFSIQHCIGRQLQYYHQRNYCPFLQSLDLLDWYLNLPAL